MRKIDLTGREDSKGILLNHHCKLLKIREFAYYASYIALFHLDL